MRKTFIPFIPDALALRLNNPVALISRRTGDDKSNVSAYLRGVKRPGNGFLVRFYTAFEAELVTAGISRDVKSFIRITPHKRRTTKEAVWRTIVRKLDKRIALLESIEKLLLLDRQEFKALRKDVDEIKKRLVTIELRGLTNRQRPYHN